MLHWLAGQKPHDTNGDPDTTGYIDPPDTPAPVFAVRAFKHAIFGTPGTQQKPPRRHSNADNARPRQGARPLMNRPQSTSDARMLDHFDKAIAPEPLSSPTKGILLTPGTAGGKRKTVSFGLNVLDNEDKRPVKSGLPDDCPGKFPSPWAKSDMEHLEEHTARGGGRSKLTEALEQVRDESAKKKMQLSSKDKTKEEAEHTADLFEPKSESGRYWKQEYDIYRERTTREVKKLVTKAKAAKNYARDKDDECMELADQLRQERNKVDRLEQRTAELETQLKDFEAKLKQSQADETLSKEELTRLKRGFGTTSYRRADAVTSTTQMERWRPTNYPPPTASPPAVPAHTAPSVPVKDEPKPVAQERASTRTRPRPRNTQPRVDDPWAPSSSVVPPEVPPRSPSPKGKAVTGTDPTPLQSLDTHGTKLDTRSVALSMGLQPPSPVREQPVPRSSEPYKASTDLSKPTALPRKSYFDEKEEPSIQAPQSSPFDPDALGGLPQTPVSPIELKSALRDAKKSLAGNLAAANTTNAKENVRPRSKDESGPKPSAAWTALNASLANGSVSVPEKKRVTSREGKDFREAALEKARARLAEKGLNVK